VKVTRITPPLLAVAGLFSRQAREGRKIAYQFDRPWVIDASAFEAAFGPQPVTDHHTAIAATLAWIRDRTPALARR
jgi:hypothetical protein